MLRRLRCIGAGGWGRLREAAAPTRSYYVGAQSLAVEDPQLPSEPYPASPAHDYPSMYIIPRPVKRWKGGEDACFLHTNGITKLGPPDHIQTTYFDSHEKRETLKDAIIAGVADGVGGWEDEGIDPALFSRTLIRECCLPLLTGEVQSEDPIVFLESLLKTAYGRTIGCHVQGATTVTLVHATRDKLVAINIGDSRFLIARDGATLFCSEEQQHDFDFPVQLGPKSSGINSADIWECDFVRPGDVVVVGTDGIFDNLYPEEISAQVFNVEQGEDSRARHLALAASEAAHSENRDTPFSDKCSLNDIIYRGGKVDDIACTVFTIQ